MSPVNTILKRQDGGDVGDGGGRRQRGRRPWKGGGSGWQAGDTPYYIYKTMQQYTVLNTMKYNKLNTYKLNNTYSRSERV